MADLPESHLYSFLDNNHQFLIHFFEGQKLISDLATIHQLSGAGFAYFRDSILTVQPLISFLKPGEGFGLFVDNIDPQFSFKIETNSFGLVRCLILPETFNEFPAILNGKCRLSKLFPRKNLPYTSIIPMENITFLELVNNILRDSYQIQSEVHISQDSDQSILVTMLPNFNVNKVNEIERDLKNYFPLIQKTVETIFKNHLVDREVIIEEFKKINCDFLGSKKVIFKCSCSRERILDNLRSLNSMDKKSIFSSQSEVNKFNQTTSVEIKCDYCKTCYLILQGEL
jgi:molecular chaperone Hsp33